MDLDKIIISGKGIFIFSDPAGANSVLAIIDYLIAIKKINGKDFMVFTNDTGIYGTEYKSIVKEIIFSKEKTLTILEDFKPDYIFTATSTNDFEHLWRSHLINKVKVYSFVDHWTNIKKRYHFNGELVFGDEIWVIDDLAKKEAIKEGIPESIIKIKGNPYYQKVKKFKPKVSKDYFFKKHNLDVNKQIILFISDDIRRTFPKVKDGSCKLGYDEYTVLSNILYSLKKIEENKTLSNFQLIIKLHPRSEKNKFDFLIKDYEIGSLEISCLKDCSALAINYFSTYILGMFSNMVIESLLMKKKTLRTLIGKNIIDPIDHINIKNDIVHDKYSLTKKLDQLLFS